MIDSALEDQTRGGRTQFTMSTIWRQDLAHWLQRSADDLGPLGWLVCLMPHFVDPDLIVPDAGLLTYHAFSWTAPVPGDGFDLRAVPRWSSARSGVVELAWECLAERDGMPLASNLLVLRLPGEAATWGERALPPPPVLGPRHRRQSFVLDETQNATLLGLMSSEHRLHHDVRFAHQLGYRNVLVPGLVLSGAVLHFGGLPTAHHVEAWFRKPVTVGTALSMSSHESSEPGVQLWTLNTAGTEDARVIVRSR